MAGCLFPPSLWRGVCFRHHYGGVFVLFSATTWRGTEHDKGKAKSNLQD
jgi:hypothetical protein